ncbi:hypothetical protein EYC84_002426 [Monilinia fructicola]|uniref:RPEL repeat protein n=1 Tax=Monilinia fructicola TaxID=38448 RepID=A0A5M9JNV2_MONFR|nr:hypothetical protein EYC84_002426 [Monilinia fructicola]
MDRSVMYMGNGQLAMGIDGCRCYKVQATNYLSIQINTRRLLIKNKPHHPFDSIPFNLISFPLCARMSEQIQDQERAEPLIDTTPIVRPAQHERQKSLEKLYADRPTAHELKERHILLDTDAAPGLQSAQHALEQQRISDSLKKNLEHRPTKEDLVERNILASSTAAPGIQAQQKELEKHMRADSLNEKLSHRPQPEELVHKGVLKEDPTSPIEGGDRESAEKRYEEAIEEEYAKREGGA